MDNKFEYTYTAPTEEERREILGIRRDYAPEKKKLTDLERLRALDKKVKTPPMVVSLVIGVVGLLVFGLGMALALEWELLGWGIAAGALGCIPMGLAYPVYSRILGKQKDKYGEEILALSDKLLARSE